jgi:hypothetical protein
MRAGLHGFLDDIVDTVALRKAAEHADRDSRFSFAGDNLNDLEFGLFLIGTHETAFIIPALRVTDDDILAGTNAQNLDMFGVPSANNGRRTAE